MNGYNFFNKIAVILIVSISIIVNWSGIIIGESGKNETKDSISYLNKENSKLTSSRENNGLANSPWPMFRNGQNHTGRSQYSALINNNQGKERWAFYTGSGYSSPAIGSDGTIYVGGYKKFYTVNPNGTEKWDFTTVDLISSSPAISSDGTIYFGSYDSKFYALNSDGSEKWNYTAGTAILTSPVIGSDGTIYFGADKFYALYPNGTEKWTFGTESYMMSSPAIGPAGTIYFGSQNGKLYALNSNGTEKWNFSTISSSNGIESSPAIGSDNVIYFGCDNGKLYALYENGTEKWEFTQDMAGPQPITSSPGIGLDGTVFFGGGRLYALNSNGTEKWDYNLYKNTGGDSVSFSSPTIDSSGYSYFGTMKGDLYALDRTGHVSWTFPTDGHIQSSPTIGSDGTIYIQSGNGNLYAIGLTYPTAPQNLTVTEGNGSAILNWSAPTYNGGTSAKILYYTIYRNGTRLEYLHNPTSLTYTDTGLINGITYWYNVSASNGARDSPLSIGIRATPKTIPTAPRNWSVIAGYKNVSLAWHEPANDGGGPIRNYNIYRGRDTYSYTIILKGYSNGTSWVDTNVTAGVTYVYKIGAVNDAGEGIISDGKGAIPYTEPDAPTILIKSNISKIALSWTIPNSNGANITGYNIYRGLKPGSETILLQGHFNGTPSWIDTNITLGTKYYYLVSANNIAGEGQRSNEISTTPIAVPNAPILSIKTNYSKIILSWTIPNSNGANITGYNIYRGLKPGSETILLQGHFNGTPSWIDTNITLGTKYYYLVSANNIAGEGQRSNEQNATPTKKGIIGNNPIPMPTNPSSDNSCWIVFGILIISLLFCFLIFYMWRNSKNTSIQNTREKYAKENRIAPAMGHQQEFNTSSLNPKVKRVSRKKIRPLPDMMGGLSKPKRASKKHR